jgi:hypothetical protein
MNTHKITTPNGSQEIEIKSWITGRDAEHIEQLMYEALSVKTDMTGKADIEKIDLTKVISETNHRKIQTFVVSIDGNTENILDTVLDMHEDDTKFILDAIDEQRKKK